MTEELIPTKWELYNVPEDQIEGGVKTELPTFTEDGLYTVKIIEAKYIDENSAPDDKPHLKDTYSLVIESVEEGKMTGARGYLTYWVKNEQRTAFKENVLGTLRSLGKAIFGENFNGMMPAPCDVVGRVAVADIKMSRPDSLGRVFPRVYRWEPATADYALFSEKPQYFRQVRAQ